MKPFSGLHPHITLPRLQTVATTSGADAPDIWTVRMPLVLFGAHFGTRMTVVRLPDDGGLWLHSPVRPTADLKKELDALGEVRHIVAPSKFHHLFVGPCQEAWPEAKTWLAPGLADKRDDLDYDGVLSDAAPPAWEGVIDQVVYDAAPMMNETVFFHRPSRTLILTDLAMNFRVAHTTWTRIIVGLYGAWQTFGPTLAIRFATKDDARARRAVEQMLSWDFDRVSVCHGEIYDGEDVREALRSGFSWLFE